MVEGVGPVDGPGRVIYGECVGPAKVARVEERPIGAIHEGAADGRGGAPIGPEQGTAFFFFFGGGGGGGGGGGVWEGRCERIGGLRRGVEE